MGVEHHGAQLRRPLREHLLEGKVRLSRFLAHHAEVEGTARDPELLQLLVEQPRNHLAMNEARSHEDERVLVASVGPEVEDEVKEQVQKQRRSAEADEASQKRASQATPLYHRSLPHIRPARNVFPLALISSLCVR